MAAGDLDQSFGTGGRATIDFGPADQLVAMELLPDGKLLLLGDSILARLNPDGSPDDTFGVLNGAIPIGGIDLAVAPSGAITILRQNHELRRYSANGAVDTMFGGGDGILEVDIGNVWNDSNRFTDIAELPDGGLILAGSGNAGTDQFVDEGFLVARLTADGHPDATFSSDGMASSADLRGMIQVSNIIASPDGSVFVAGSLWPSRENPWDFALARFLSDGSPDPFFGRDGVQITNFGMFRVNGEEWPSFDLVNTAAVLDDGRIILAGYSDIEEGAAMAVYTSAGRLDVSAGGGDGLLTGNFIAQKDVNIRSILSLSDGGFYSAGTASTSNQSSEFFVARHRADGTLATSFGGDDGYALTGTTGGSLVAVDADIQADGKIVVAGISAVAEERDYAVLRYHGAPAASIAGRHIFYNNSIFDGNDVGPNAPDDAAVATDKQALLPGQSRGSVNVTSYTKGINGIMIDLLGLTGLRDLRASDFLFHVSNAAGWVAAPQPSSVNVRRGAGTGGSDRVTITWPDGAIRNTWLRVTSLANVATGLATPDVFYVGNLVGDTGDRPTMPRTSTFDISAVRRALNTISVIRGRFDFNRDGKVDAKDVAAARTNLGRLLRPITAGMAWGAKISEPFGSRVYAIASNLALDANHLMAVMAFETDEQFRAYQYPNGAVGLIQFTTIAVDDLNRFYGLSLTKAVLAAMTEIEQLDYVEKYLAMWTHRKGPLNTLADLYMAIFAPVAGIGKPLDAALYSGPGTDYDANRGLDFDGDLRITKAEATRAVEAKLAKGFQPGNVG